MMLTRTRRCPELAEIPAFMPVHEFTLRRLLLKLTTFELLYPIVDGFHLQVDWPERCGNGAAAGLRW